MEPWYVIAIVDMSCGNESVGEMWQDTKQFDNGTPVCDIMAWAAKHKNSSNPENFRGRLTLTIGN
jgi:hypothetical protein